MATLASDLSILHKQYILKQGVVKHRHAIAKDGQQVWILLLGVSLFVILAAQLMIRISIIQNSYQVEELRREALQKDAKLRQLRLEYAFLTRPAALGRAAKERLGMVELAPQRVRQFAVSFNDRWVQADD